MLNCLGIPQFTLPVAKLLVVGLGFVKKKNIRNNATVNKLVYMLFHMGTSVIVDQSSKYGFSEG